MTADCCIENKNKLRDGKILGGYVRSIYDGLGLIMVGDGRAKLGRVLALTKGVLFIRGTFYMTLTIV
jgi:hypothetical protein